MNYDEALAQCSGCGYTESLTFRSDLRLLRLNRSFGRSPEGIYHNHPDCGAAVRLWTGKPYAFRLKGA